MQGVTEGEDSHLYRAYPWMTNIVNDNTALFSKMTE
jgi:hypothetical protein